MSNNFQNQIATIAISTNASAMLQQEALNIDQVLAAEQRR